ncbi:MAG: HAMP domain-containing histidine kinase [Lachnospiraceae bacterium]|nr:HAMP domain-containing histidine kinase [Lachnospiraceae bacterium]
MNRLLHLLQHIVFVAFAVLFVNVVLFNRVPFETVKDGRYLSYISGRDTDKVFEESETFNEMFGLSIADIIDYCGILDRMNSGSKEHKNSGDTLSSSYSFDGQKNISYYNELYGKSDGNILFYAIEKYNNTVSRQTNLNDRSMSDADLKKKILEQCNKYVYIDASNGIFETNTLINEKTLYTLFRQSSYEYPIDTVFMAGIRKNINDTDNYFEAQNAFYSYTQFYYLKSVLLVVLAIAYIFLLIIISAGEGQSVNKETGEKYIKTYQSDKIPFEIRGAIIALILIPAMLFFSTSSGRLLIRNSFLDIYVRNPLHHLGIVALLALMISLIIEFFYYGFVRRVKARIWWNTSILHIIFKKLGEIWNAIYLNLPVFLKTVLPYGAFVLINLLFMYIDEDVIIFLLIADAFVGYLLFRDLKERYDIISVIDKICAGDIKAKADENMVHGENTVLANAVNRIGKSVNDAVNVSLKDEKMKTDLITNVSHDLKTPLTSMITYVDLLKKENIDNEKAVNYINILDEKSQRLKQLTDDLVEASKISSGNIVFNYEKIGVKALIDQINAEFIDKLSINNLTTVINAPESELYISADPRSIFRVFENLMSNINKYALSGTRVYLDVNEVNKSVLIQLKNISANPLNISTDELLERFVRGDESRTTEGSGLGLSIAKNLTEAMGGRFGIALDGDLFKVTLSFDKMA